MLTVGVRLGVKETSDDGVHRPQDCEDGDSGGELSSRCRAEGTSWTLSLGMVEDGLCVVAFVPFMVMTRSLI
jgi:hypothetical protein